MSRTIFAADHPDHRGIPKHQPSEADASLLLDSIDRLEDADYLDAYLTSSNDRGPAEPRQPGS